MSPNPWDAWPKREPPAHFAERTAAAVVRDMHARARRVGRIRSALVGALAAVLVGGAAWGWARTHSRAAAVAPPSVPAAVPGAPKPVAGRPSSLLPMLEPEGSPAASSTPASASAAAVTSTQPAVRRRSVSPPAPTTSVMDAGRSVIVPRCACEPGQQLCDCIE